MAQAVVDPAELRRFAQNLRHFNTELHNKMAVIHGQLSGLSQTCATRSRRSSPRSSRPP